MNERTDEKKELKTDEKKDLIIEVENDENSGEVNANPDMPQESKKKLFAKLGKKKWIVVGAVIVVVILALCSGGGDEMPEESYDWPDAEIAEMIPEPEGVITSLSYDDEYLWVEVEIDSADICKEYIDECKDWGFDKKADFSCYEDDYYYDAYNKEKWNISIDNMNGVMYIDLYAPSYYEDDDEDLYDDEEDADDDDAVVSADFKETLDDYEDFMDDYIAFMKKYQSSDNASAMLADYTDMLTQYSEFATKIDSIDTDSLSDSDYAYYIDVTTRVANKLAKASL